MVLTLFTALTGELVDEIASKGLGRQQRQLGQSCPLSIQSILSTRSMPSQCGSRQAARLFAVRKNIASDLQTLSVAQFPG